MFLQKNSTSELHDQFPPCLKLKKYAEAKTHCTWQENGLPADINRQVLATSRGSLGKKNHTFRLTLSFRKKMQWIKLPTKQNTNTLTYHQEMGVCVINFSAELALGTTSAMGHKNPRQEI